MEIKDQQLNEEPRREELEPETYPDRRIRLILDNMGSKHGVTLRGWFLVLLALALVAGIVLLAMFAFDGSRRERASRLSRLEAENQYLREKLNLYETQLDSLYARLDTLGLISPELRALDPNTGGGGPSGINRLRVNPGLGRQLSLIESKISSLSQWDGTSEDGEPRFELPEGFDNRGDGIPAIYPTFGRITDGWGWRYHPVTSVFEFHTGLDIANRVGTPVYATADGIVTRAHRENGFGRVITISHAGGYQSLYAHLHSFRVRAGQVVCKGQIIGSMGNTGLSTGPHLHYGVSRDGVALNPSVYLNRIDTNTFVRR